MTIERSRSPMLLIPGPSEVSERVFAAMLKPAIGSGDPKFVETGEQTCEMLRKIFRTKNEVILLPGSGTYATEAAAVSLIEPGDKVLLAVNGVYGKQFRDIVARVGGEPIEIAVDWRNAVDPVTVKEKLETEKDIKAICVVHNETTTAIVNPIGEIAKIAKDHNCLYIVDSVSSLGGVDVRTDEWNIDINCSAPQKCLGSLSGLAILAVSDRAWDIMSKRKRPPTSFSLDLYRWMQLWVPRERGGKLIWGERRSPFTLSTHLVYALNEALKIIMEEGFENVLLRHRKSGRAMRAGVKAIGLELHPKSEEFASDVVTGIVNPQGTKVNIIRTLRDKFGIVIGGGLEDLAGKILRIAHMGNTADEAHVTRVLLALEEVMLSQGWRCDYGSSIKAARKIFA